jgi:hypothetical protein
MVPYDLTTPLFSDYTLKYRSVYLPPGESPAPWRDTPLEATTDRAFAFPVGTVVTKTFADAPRTCATLRSGGASHRDAPARARARRLEGAARTSGTRSRRTPATGAHRTGQRGARVDPHRRRGPVHHELRGPQRGRLPSLPRRGPGRMDLHRSSRAGAACGTSPTGTASPSGPARGLARPGPHRSTAGRLAGRGSGLSPVASTMAAPWRIWRSVEDDGPALDRHVRAYLDANCASCHNPNGDTERGRSRLPAPHRRRGQAGRVQEPRRRRLGGPGWAGPTTSCPGRSDASVLVFRIESEFHRGAQPRQPADAPHRPLPAGTRRGSELIRSWIEWLATRGGGRALPQPRRPQLLRVSAGAHPRLGVASRDSIG